MTLEPCISTTAVEPPLPVGWFSIARSHELECGAVLPVHAFERDLVLYRSESGVAVVHDAYCPHLGAHLGHGGTVAGESIRCPFHGFRFGTDGNCVEIPYCDEIPERTRLRTWPVCEVNGCVMVWYHPEEAAPGWPVPVIEEFQSDTWTEPRLWEFTAPTHVHNLAENTCDPQHFHYVHQQPETPPSTVTIAKDGRVMQLVSHAKPNSNLPVAADFVATVYNPGLATVRTIFSPGAEMLMYNTSQPVSRKETLSRWALAVTNEIAETVGDAAMQGIMDGIDDDMKIWRHKIHRDKPAFCKGDSDLVTFRKWVRQFYL